MGVRHLAWLGTCALFPSPFFLVAWLGRRMISSLFLLPGGGGPFGEKREERSHRKEKEKRSSSVPRPPQVHQRTEKEQLPLQRKSGRQVPTPQEKERKKIWKRR